MLYSRTARGESLQARSRALIRTFVGCQALEPGFARCSRLPGCGALSSVHCRSDRFGTGVTHCRHERKRRETVRSKCARRPDIELWTFGRFEGKQWQGLDIIGGGQSWVTFVWEGRRQAQEQSDGAREGSCQYPTTAPETKHANTSCRIHQSTLHLADLYWTQVLIMAAAVSFCAESDWHTSAVHPRFHLSCRVGTTCISIEYSPPLAFLLEHYVCSFLMSTFCLVYSHGYGLQVSPVY